ncbi:dol-P-Man:Man(7)GlcNAc(2)-PP-Dol alpha-1,6-mannosyltransferase isoform X2 [Periplaneta americana]
MFRQAIQSEFGHQLTNWFVSITITQYHFMYYLSRPLPNIMALPLVLLALHSWIKQQHAKFIYFSAAAIIIFRAELALFLGILLLIELVNKQIQPLKLLKYAIPAGLIILSLTVIIDSIFWNRLLWPEGEVLFFNTVLNRSHEWGTSPFLWYFYSAIPRGMGCSVFLVPLGIYYESRVRKLVLPALAFVFLFSFLPHKELRFIIYIFPLLNITAASACHRIFENRGKSSFHGFLAFGVCCHLVLNAVFSVFLLCIAGANYPGGNAITRLHRLARNEPFVFVHIDVLTAQTGVSRFTQDNPNWRYSKAENLTSGSTEMMAFTHLLLEAKSKYSQNLKPYSRTHDILDSVEGFSHIAFNYNTFPPIRIKTKPMIFILRKRDAYKDIYLKREEIELPSHIEELPPSDIEELPIDIDLQTEVKEDLLGNIEDTLELDETLESPSDLDEMQIQTDVFGSLVLDDDDDEHRDSPLIDLNIEPTEDIEEEVQLSKLMRMTREDLIKELNRAEGRARIHPKSGNVKRNIKKIIRQYKALEDKELKLQETKDTELPPQKIIKSDEYIQLQDSQIPAASEENYSDIHSESIHEYEEQVSSKAVLEEYEETDLPKNIDSVISAETEAQISPLPFDNLTHEDEFPDVKLQKGKRMVEKDIKKYKMLDQDVEEESLSAIDNMTDDSTTGRKKAAQKSKLTKQTKKGILEGVMDIDSVTETDQMPVAIENDTLEEISVKPKKKIKKAAKNIEAELSDESYAKNDDYSHTKASDGNVMNLENVTTENGKQAPEEGNVVEISENEDLKEIFPDQGHLKTKIKKGNAARKIKKDKSKSSLSSVDKIIDNTDDGITKLDSTYVQDFTNFNQEENEISKDENIEFELRNTLPEKIIGMENNVEVQEHGLDSLSLKKPKKKFTKKTSKSAKESIHSGQVLPNTEEAPDIQTSETPASTRLDEESTMILESSQDIKSPEEKSSTNLKTENIKQGASQDTETDQPSLQENRQGIQNDETIEYDDVESRKLGEEVIQM